jgi:signal peptide peptidase SppA
MKHLLNAFKGSRPLKINLMRAKTYLETVANISITPDLKAASVNDMLELMFGKPRQMEIVGKKAIIPVCGVIGKGLSEIEKRCNAVDLDDVAANLKEAMANHGVDEIVMEFNSPGGTCDGLEEVGELIENCNKPTTAVSVTECCSAAYELASRCERVCGTPSSSWGSVGVYIAFADLSEAYAMEGVKMEVIKAGKHKAMGLEGTSLTKEDKEYLQDDVDERRDQFRATVKRRRLFAKDEDMEGQVWEGKKAAQKGLITHIIREITDVVEPV